MFCSIECNRSLPIKTDPSSAGFRKDFEDWCNLTHNILVWDFGEMKAYVIAALLWNPYVNVDSVINEFATGFYGAGATDVLNYYQLADQSLTASKARLDIFGNPVSPNQTWLTTKDLKNYNVAINKAIAATDSSFRMHVLKQSLTLQYVFLEQSKFYGTGEFGIFEKQNEKWIVKKSVRKMVADFVSGLKAQSIRNLNENGLTPDEYATQWERIFEHGMLAHLGMDKKVNFGIPYSEQYPAKGAATLTDGIGGYDDYHYNWLGWQGCDMNATVDLGTVQTINSVSCGFMDDQKSWIFFPSAVDYFYSVDGKTFLPFANCKGDEPVPAKIFSSKTFMGEAKKETKARYIKVVATSLKQCPIWHIGALNNCWIFCDEIVIR